ncbi:sugar ABC transporter permease [Jiella sp. MQZ9-1]|uniref:sn-glycerol-3-phosphate transport system permease protein UgpA n=1 Tax=Jiella flava TaxID=2816857 RepID=A0A939JTT6_9HYPH|nr:sugar ABC transporter permease [Jiella flava]MBO0662465.1 sugar ABC transporter permease [Jiella flava]MCD2471690.1 sugar ABC transporter permease [Jiella flava]
MARDGQFQGRWWPILLSLPQLLLIFLFFYWPVVIGLKWSFFLERPFGGSAEFVGLANFQRLFQDTEFYAAAGRSLVFMLTASAATVLFSFVLAVAADRKLRLSGFARNVLFWPQALAGASAGVVLSYLFNPATGVFSWLNTLSPGLWNPVLDGFDANILLNIAYMWGRIPIDFAILLAGLQAIPESYHQAAAVDGAGPWRRLLDLQLPLLTPQIFLCIVIEFNESFNQAFKLIESMTHGGPGNSTNQLVYKIFVDGFRGYDLSGSSTQSLILMLLFIFIVVAQFALLERRVNYAR